MIQKILKKSSIIICLCLLLINVMQAQVCFERWYDFSINEYGLFVEQCKDTGYVISFGIFDTVGNLNLSIRLIKTNLYGDVLWSKKFGDTLNEWAGEVILTNDGGFAMVGTKGVGTGYYVWLIKTDKNGNLLWEKTYGWGDDSGMSIQQTNDDGYILGGWTAAGGILRLILIKVDSSGNAQWQKKYGIGTWSTFNSVKQTPDGGYIIGGALAKNTGTLDDVYVMKTDSAGFISWSKTFDGGMSYWDNGFAIDLTNDGGYIIAGYSNYYDDAPPFSNQDGFVIRLDVSGNELWRRTFAYSGHDVFTAIHQLPKGGFIVAEGSDKDGTGNSDMWLLKLNENGDSLWSRRFGGALEDVAWDMQITSDGGYILSGYNESVGAGYGYLYLVKTDSLGFIIDCDTIPVGNNFENTQDQKDKPYIKIHPNPNNGKVILQYKLPQETIDAYIVIYDLKGTAVKIIRLNKDDNSAELSLVDLSNSSYFINLIADNKVIINLKIVLLK